MDVDKSWDNVDSQGRRMFSVMRETLVKVIPYDKKQKEHTATQGMTDVGLAEASIIKSWRQENNGTIPEENWTGVFEKIKAVNGGICNREG